jgi:nitrite reductase/ring-hydroxylating ferredoxin subunit
MFKKIVPAGFLVILSFIILATSACSSRAEGAGNSDSITAKQTMIQAVTSGESVSIPASDIEKLVNTRFQVKTNARTLTYMAYKYNDQTYVRADICPPCRSESFTLKNGTLSCDACGTTFNAKTGIGVKGACVKYPKQSVPFEIKDGAIVMQQKDLNEAYLKTLNPA